MSVDKDKVELLLRTVESLYDHYKDLDDEYFKGKAAAFSFVLETVEEIFDDSNEN
jgi:hypothetical protein